MAKRLLIDGQPIGYVPTLTANMIGYSNTASGLTAIEVQSALDEITTKVNAKQDSFSARDGVSLSNGILSNTGVRAATINGNYLKINTNGTDANLTIPYATSAGDGISNITRSGTTFTVTRTNGSTFTFTQKDDNTTYSANNGVGLSGTTFYNTGVRAVTINGNYLKVNTNGTDANLTIPYATSAGNGISNITRSGTTFTVTRANGTTFTFTQKDDNTTYSAGTGISLSGTTFSNSGIRDMRTKTRSVSGRTEMFTEFNVNGSWTQLQYADIASSLFSGWTYCYIDNNNAGLKGRSGYHLLAQDDGNLVWYDASNHPIWQTNTSSVRFKHNIQSMTEERAKKILNVRAVTFDWNDDQPITTQKEDNAGVIAEEVSKVIPDVVVFEETEEGMVERRVEYERFTPYLIKLCQMQQEQIDEMKAEIEALKDKLN